MATNLAALRSGRREDQTLTPVAMPRFFRRPPKDRSGSRAVTSTSEGAHSPGPKPFAMAYGSRVLARLASERAVIDELGCQRRSTN